MSVSSIVSKALEQAGIHKVFEPGLPGETVAEYIKENIGKLKIN